MKSSQGSPLKAFSRQQLGITDELPLGLRKKRVWLLVKLLAKRLSDSDRHEVLKEWELHCAANGLEPKIPDQVFGDQARLS
jgi:hypothetical protein